MTVPDFVKYQALGNDYLVIDPHRTDLPCTPEAVRRLCDRHTGVGADGVLRGPLGAVRAGEPVAVETFNSDGTVCARSANGVRMFALHLAEAHLKDDTFLIRTPAGDSPVRIDDLDTGLVSVDLGRPRLDPPETLAVAGREFTVRRVDNGNPHAVIVVDEVSRDLAYQFGEAIAGHPRFPGRTNVQFVQLVDRTTLRAEIWERGAGYTLASGASSCAAASAAYAAGLIDPAVRVLMPGGELKVSIDRDGGVTMAGVVEQVMSGRLASALRDRLTAAG